MSDYEYRPIKEAKAGDIVEYVGFKDEEPVTSSFNIGSYMRFAHKDRVDPRESFCHIKGWK